VTAFARLVIWVFVAVLLLQLVQGGWGRMRQWLSVKFIGVQRAA
jgi:hypothetical protein